VFRANDTFTMSLSGDLSGAGSIKGTRAASLNYVIPHGKDTFSLSFSKSRYHQTIQSNPYDFTYGGNSTTMKAKWDHVWSRTQREKRAFDISIRMIWKYRCKPYARLQWSLVFLIVNILGMLRYTLV